MFGYGYIILNDTQLTIRRQRLNEAGWHSYLAPIFVLLFLGAYTRLSNTLTHGKKYYGSTKPSYFEHIARRFSWMLNTTYISELGPLHVQLLGLVYTAYLLFRVTKDTGNDYMHVTKAFGHVAISQLPMHYLLAIKSPVSPVTLITGVTHERLNAYHRLFGRILHALLATHAILYLRFFMAKDLLSKRMRDGDVRLGLLAFWSVNILALLAIPPVRKAVYYKVFYRSHVLLSGLLLPILGFHVPYTRRYVAQAAIIYIFNGMTRRGASQPAIVKCDMVGNDIVLVKAKTSGPHIHPYMPGVHVYLNREGTILKTPFTVVSARALEKGQTEIQLIAKNSGGPMTSILAQAATTNEELQMVIEGPYGEAQKYIPALIEEARTNKNAKFLLIASGVGATYILPIFQALRSARGTFENIRVVWVVSRETDMAWAANFLKIDQELQPVIVHVTRSGAEVAPPCMRGEVFKEGRHEPDLDAYIDDFVNERLKKSEKEGIFWERDPIKEGQMLHDTVTVMVCGPRGLSRVVRRALGRHVNGYGGDVTWFEEQFGFGGS